MVNHVNFLAYHTETHINQGTYMFCAHSLYPHAHAYTLRDSGDLAAVYNKKASRLHIIVLSLGYPGSLVLFSQTFSSIQRFLSLKNLL